MRRGVGEVPFPSLKSFKSSCLDARDLQEDHGLHTGKSTRWDPPRFPRASPIASRLDSFVLPAMKEKGAWKRAAWSSSWASVRVAIGVPHKVEIGVIEVPSSVFFLPIPAGVREKTFPSFWQSMEGLPLLNFPLPSVPVVASPKERRFMTGRASGLISACLSQVWVGIPHGPGALQKAVGPCRDRPAFGLARFWNLEPRRLIEFRGR